MFIVIFSLLLLAGCKTVYVPVKETRTEYRDKYHRDSIYIHDSTYLYKSGDTVYLEKIKYFYRDKFRTDTFIFTDTIPRIVVQKETVTKQVVPAWCWWLLLITGGYGIFRVIKWKLK